MHAPKYLSKRPKSRATRRRIKATGLGRLLITVAILSFLSFGTGLLWWLGFGLLTIVLVTVTQSAKPGSSWWAALGLMSLAFVHQHLIPLWLAAISAVVALYALIHNLPQDGHHGPSQRSYMTRWRGAPPTVRVPERVSRNR